MPEHGRPRRSTLGPIVLYNPHVAPHLSSWYRHGRAILDYFLHNRRFNLIFAPHVMLFHRALVTTLAPPRIRRPGIVERRFRDAPDIHIDPGSSASSDMTYTRAAHIYLGDASSQVYELLHRPRPCLFFDSHGTDHVGDTNFAHWQAGTVVRTIDGLGAALTGAIAGPHRFDTVQRGLFASHVHLEPRSSSERAAEVIERLAGRDIGSSAQRRRAIG